MQVVLFLIRKSWFVSFLFGIIFLLVGIFTLPHYGIDWDTINHLPRGQAYLHYILTGNKSFDTLEPFVSYHQKDNTLFFAPVNPTELIPRRSVYQINGYDANYFLHKDGGHPPLSGLIASIFNLVFFQKLGWINDIDSYHLYVILMASILVGVVHLWTSKYFGFFAAFITTLSLALYPLFLGESHFNLKDIPETAFYSLTIICFFEGVSRKRNAFILLSAIFFGLAWATKFNVLFSLFTLGIWFAFYIIFNKERIENIKYFIPSFLLFPIISFSILFASWPFLWSSPVQNLAQVFAYYRAIGINTSFSQDYIFLGLNTYAMQWILYTTPLVIIFFSFFGILYVIRNIRKDSRKLLLLLLFWLTIPVARVTMPSAGIYGGVRQLMEYVPVLAVLAGIGALYILQIFSRRNIKPLFIKTLVVVSFVPLLFKLISIHPNENVYFNQLIGGLKGAQEKNIPFWGNSFGNAYRQGTNWLNKNAELNSNLVFSQELMINIPAIWVRKDINFSNLSRSGYMKGGEYVIGLNYGDKQNQSYYSSQYYNRFLDPLYQIKVDGVNIANIWKNDVNHTKKNLEQEEKKSYTSFDIQRTGVMLNLEDIPRVTRIEWEFSKNSCSPPEAIYFEVSPDGKIWTRTPHVLPNEYPIPTLGEQPMGNKISYPVAGEKARFIFINISPQEACVKQVKLFNIWYIPEM